MMVCMKSLCLSFLVVLVCFLALPRLADEEPINSRSSGRDSSYNEDSHVVLTDPLQAAGVVSPFLGSKSQAVVGEKNGEQQEGEEQREHHPLPVLTQHPILMQPSLADFKEVPVGMPQIKTITINNPSPSQTLQLTSVSGDTPDFHPSFFQSKVVRPGESTTFDIVFLPRRVGRVGTVLYIHTSLGTFKYEVYGTGVPNPYRLRAFLGIKIPVNATYSPIVSMYNPYSTSLQITEIYSSGGDLHLELLTGQSEGSKSLWEIRPYETKPIIKLSFFGRTINNHTGFIRIKVNSSLEEESPIALPVEVKVTQATGIFLSREFIDFGLLKSGDDVKPVPLFLLNAGPGSVHVSSISTVPPNEAIQIQYTPSSLRQGSKYVKIASVIFHIDKVKDYSQHQGKIVIVFEDPSMDILEIPYEATVMQGTVTYEKTQTLFKVGKPPFKPVVRNMSLANQFQSPITLYDVRLPAKAQEHFTVNLFKSPFILYPNSGWQKPFSVKFTPLSSDCQFSTSLRLHTNSSFFTIPLHCYDGKLKYEVQDIDKDSLEYGLMRHTDTISKRFRVININPVKISVTDYRVKLVDHANVELVHVRPSEDLRTVLSESNGNYTEYKPLRTPFTIDVGHEAVFEVNITKPNVKGRQEGEILIKTSLGKELHVPIFYKVVLGTLQVEPEVVVLKYGHPFTEVSANFSAWSFFDQPVKVISVQPDPPNPQFYYVPPQSGMPLLESEKMTEMGSIVFSPSKEAQSSQKPYLGLDQDDGRSSMSSWTYSLNGISNQRVAETDARDYKLMRGLWNKAKTKKVKGLLILETDMNSSHEMNVEASLYWPSLLPNTTISFPTTLVGNTSVKHVTVNNPSDYPLLVQALTLAVYPKPDSILHLLKSQFSFNTSVFDTSDLTTFYLPDSEAFENAVPTDLSQEHHDVTTVAHSPLTVTTMIPPHSSAVVRVAFSPKVESNFTSLLLLRNNLTILDALIVHGYGAAVQLLFGGKEPGSSSALLFEYTEASLIQCHKELAAANSLRLVKTFIMRNTGQLPVHILSMDFSGYGCSNYGFMVENCSNEFVLEPNATKDIRVSFTPDFTMSRIQQTLVLHMTHGTELAFILLATLPHSLLPICYAALPRLDIEKMLSKITAAFMVLLLVVVVVMAVYSARYSNICQYYELDLLHHNSSVFDLNNLTEDGYVDRNEISTGPQAETIRPGKTNCTREGHDTVTQCSQTSAAVTNFQEPSFNASTKLKTPLEDATASNSQKTLENIVQSSSQNSTESSATQLERRRNNSQSMEDTDNHNLKHSSSDLGNNGIQPMTRASKPVAAVAGTSRCSPGKTTNKVDSYNDGSTPSASVEAVKDFASQMPPLSTSSSLPVTESTVVVDAPSYHKRKLSRKQSNKALRHQSSESNTTKKSDIDKKAEAKSTQEKARPEKELVVEKESDTHEQVVVKEKARDKVKPFTKDAGTGQAIPVEDAPHEGGGLDAEDDLDDVGKKDNSARGKDKKKRSRVPPKKEEKESKRRKDREVFSELMDFSKSKRLSSESIEVESTTSTENLDDENQSGDSDEKPVKSGNTTTDAKEDAAKNNRPNDSPTGQSAPLEEEAPKEQPAAEQQHTKHNEKKTLQLTEILSDPFSRKPDKTSYNSKKVISTSKKQSAERTKSASSEEPDDSKPPTPVGGVKLRAKSNKQSDGDVSGKAEEQEAKSPESKVGDGVRLTTPHEIAASLLNKNTAIATRSKMKVERETKEPPTKCEVHPTTKSPPLGKTNEMLAVEGYTYMPGHMPHHHHHHPRYPDMRAEFNRPDHAAALSLHAEPFVPTVVSKENFYDDPRQINRMEVSRLQTGKTLGDYLPPSVTQAPRHHFTKKHQENMFGENKPMFEDPRAMRHGNMMLPVQQKVSPTMSDDSPTYHQANYHSERMSHDPHYNYRYSNPEHHHEGYFEEDYSGLQSFDQQLVSRSARPSNLQYNLPEDGVSFQSSGMSGSHNIISASGCKGMNMMQGGGLTLTSPTSMFESPKKQQPPSIPNYQRPPPGHSMSGGSDEGYHTRLSRQHYIQHLQSHHQQQLKASKQLHRMPPPGLGDPHIGEMIHDRGSGGGIPWGTADELGNDPMSLQMQQQQQQLHLREQQRRQFLLQQQRYEMDDYGEMLPSLHTSVASPVFPPPSLNLAPGSGFSSSMYEPRSSPMDLGWDNSKTRDNLQSDVHWGGNSSSANSSATVSMLWGGQSSFGGGSNRPMSTPQEETNSSEPPKFSGNIYGLFDGSGSIWDPAASSSNSSLLPWATQTPSEHKDNTPN